ncbi:MAG: FIST C-terminal domain-containing protein [Magnetococcales bacterium]|nr:FIST C-terminal domain-containing protein [Magnetococcales bacterium]MBF0632487.1 FIST C-terminal domain-containing protein [Magnetococcales bacterium]
MEIRQIQFRKLVFDRLVLEPLQQMDPMLVLVFADKKYLMDPAVVSGLNEAFPDVPCVGVSTAGEISNQGMGNESCVVTAMRFAHGSVRVATAAVTTLEESRQAGVAVGKGLSGSDLRAVLLFAPGLSVNGCALIDGLCSIVGDEMEIVGGLACESGLIRQTLVMSSSEVSSRRVVAVGLYGDHLAIRRCSQGGWVPFGPMRKVTRCEGSVLLELDGEPALDLYSRYLGEYARELPDSGLRFPFEMHHARPCSTDPGVIRTVLDVDRSRGGLILGGVVDPDGYVRLMHVTSAKMVSGAGQAADCVQEPQMTRSPGLGLLISCVGRKLIMGDQIVEELEMVRDRLGRQHTVTGFYAHSEIGPLGATRTCALHNLTMTIALITEDL